MKRAVFIGIMLASLVNVGWTQTTLDSQQQQLSDAEKLYGLSLLWSEAKYNFAFFDQVPELDWDQAYKEYIPAVLDTKSTYEYYRVLKRFYALLKDGHSNVYFPEGFIEKYIDVPAVALQEVDHRAIVRDTESSLADSLPVGSEILAVDGVPTTEYLVKHVMPYISSSTEHILWDWSIRSVNKGLLVGTPGSEVLVKVVKPDGKISKLKLTRNRFSEQRVVNGGNGNSGQLLEFKPLDGDLSYIALNSFGDRKIVAQFESLFSRLQDSKGIIIDLRSNGGGSTGIGAGIAAFLTSETMVGSAWRTRKHIAAMKGWASYGSEKHEDYLTGDVWYSEPPDNLVPGPGPKLTMPITVLIGRKTASAAEDFLIFLDKVEHVTLIGEPTFCSTGQPVRFDLPGGGMARICTIMISYPDGRDFVGSGIQPDIVVRPTVDSIREGRDPVLERAIKFLREQI